MNVSSMFAALYLNRWLIGFGFSLPFFKPFKPKKRNNSPFIIDLILIAGEIALSWYARGNLMPCLTVSSATFTLLLNIVIQVKLDINCAFPSPQHSLTLFFSASFSITTVSRGGKKRKTCRSLWRAMIAIWICFRVSQAVHKTSLFSPQNVGSLHNEEVQVGN